MKATIEIPYELFRQVNARAASQSRTIREVTDERLYRDWLSQQRYSQGKSETELSLRP